MTSQTHSSNPYQALFDAAINGVVVVPTRSLVTHLDHEFALAQLSSGLHTWLQPQIVSWSDWVKELWRLNQMAHAELAVQQPITATQSCVVWERVIASAKGREDELRLLNVAQTARAVQAAHALCLEWRITDDTLNAHMNLDLAQFNQWRQAYRQECADHKWLDPEQLAESLSLVSDLRTPAGDLTFYAFDALSPLQQRVIEKLRHSGRIQYCAHPQQAFTQEWSAPSADQIGTIANTQTITEYADEVAELEGVLRQARALLEADPSVRLSVVVPDLAERLPQVERLAHSVFYPSDTPLAVNKRDKAYRFSLGARLTQWTAVQVALIALKGLKGAWALRDFRVLITSAHCAVLAPCRSECERFIEWLMARGQNKVAMEELQALLDDFMSAHAESSAFGLFKEVMSDLTNHHQSLIGDSERRALMDWRLLFDDWLGHLGWRTGVSGLDLDSTQFQLKERFEALMDEFQRLDTVHPRCGIQRAIDRLQTLCNDTIFLPQSEPTPIVISGVLDALGRVVDEVFVLGMSEDYASVLPSVPFIPRSALQQANHPWSTPQSLFQTTAGLLARLLSVASKARVSFARGRYTEPEHQAQVSALFRHASIEAVPIALTSTTTQLKVYQDEVGQAVAHASQVAHGMAVIRDFSQCAFKAYAAHRLQCRVVDEPEFGTDASVQGIVVHKVLEIAWKALRDSRGLAEHIETSEQVQMSRANDWVSLAYTSLAESFTAQQMALLEHEKARFADIAQQWLEFEASRPADFQVLETEHLFSAELEGIHYRGIIDRIDQTQDGRRVLIDYKTGSVSASDWMGDRLPNPQMPLYSMAQEAASEAPLAGVAYAQVRRPEFDFKVLAEADIFKASSSRNQTIEAQWHDQRSQWPEQLSALAKGYLSGDAWVDPINETVCQYCAFAALCRLHDVSNAELEHE